MRQTCLNLLLTLNLLACSTLADQPEPGSTDDPVMMYERGMEYGSVDAAGRVKDSEQARYWLARSAARDYLPAVHALGWMHLQGIGMQRDPEQAYLHFQRAAVAGFADSQYMLGIMYAQGWGIEASSQESLYWVREAARQGHAQARSMLQELFVAPADPAQPGTR